MPARRSPAGEQGVLGKDDIRVMGGVPVARSVADEHDGPAAGSVEPDPLTLARPADVAGRVAVREAHPFRTVDAVRVRVYRQVPERGIHALQVRGDVEAQPV